MVHRESAENSADEDSGRGKQKWFLSQRTRSCFHTKIHFFFFSLLLQATAPLKFHNIVRAPPLSRIPAETMIWGLARQSGIHDEQVPSVPILSLCPLELARSKRRKSQFTLYRCTILS